MGAPNSTSGYRMLIFVVSVVVGLLGANPFADAVGFPRLGPDHYNNEGAIAFRVLSGFVVFLLTAILMRSLVVQVRAAVARIGATPAKPDGKAALASLICGTLCVLGALWVQVYASTHPVGVAPALRLNGNPGGMTFNGNPLGMDMSLNTQASPTLAFLSVGTFLVGAGLLAFGIWATLKPDRERPGVSAPAPAPAPTAAVKPDGLGADLVDAARV